MTDETDKADLKEMNLWQRISAVRDEIKAVAKDKEVGYGKSKYKVVTHEAINAMLRPLLVKWGLVDYVTLEESTIEPTGIKYGKENPRDLMQYRGRYKYVVRSVDLGADPVKEPCMSIIVEGHGDDAGDKGPGKAATYALKTGRSKVFSIPTEDDEEGRANEDQYVNPENTPMSPKQLDDILLKADEYFGEDAEKALERLCSKIFNVEKLADVPGAHYLQVLGLLRNQAIRDGKIEGEEGDDV